MRTRSETVRLEGHAKQAIETGRNRLIMAGCLMGLAFVTVGVRVIDLSAVRNHSEPALSASADDATLTVGRADIVDRNGLLVATSLRTPSLYADPK